MKTRILLISFMSFLIALCSITIVNAQNGGILNENNSIKIEQIGYSSGKAIIKVTNKQNCNANEKVTGDIVREKIVSALSSDTFHIAPAGNLKIRAKTETNCGNTDFGNVEITVNTVVPVTFTNIKVTLTHNNKIN